ncbi:MAG: MBL fold metallo-hydrolase [Oligoflexia bacterium]|nr:MBL fold metallo-hydrolase [Oligoflexia bacterium]
MRMLLRTDYPNGLFGDPALHVWDVSGQGSMLFDCGDLSRYSIRQLLRVGSIFLSHCHMDHFFGFDTFLRAHMGVAKTVRVFGPPDTIERVEGKLRGYTWNLLGEREENLEFQVAEICPDTGRLRRARFRSRDRFALGSLPSERWQRAETVVDAGAYVVRADVLDHRTPSLCYAIEEKPAVGIDLTAIRELRLKPGPWISELKELFLFGGLDSAMIGVTGQDGSGRTYRGSELAARVLLPLQRHKLAYATDGAASPSNRETLLQLVAEADLFFAETCFLEAERALADQTLHFTADFMGALAREAGVKRLAPIHLSKRYSERPGEVLDEAARAFGGEILRVPSLEGWSCGLPAERARSG